MARAPDLRIDRLRALAAVGRAGGFSRAARALGRTQSSVSQAVAALEEDVGELLVVRDGRRTYLTEAGRVLAGHGDRVLEALAEARGAIEALRDVTTGRLALGTSDTFAMHLLPPVLAAFRRLHPEVELRLDNRPSPVIATRVAERTVDVGVVSLPLPVDLRIDGRAIADRIRVTALAPLHDVVIAPTNHPLARRRRLELSDLARHPLVLLDRSTSARAFLDAALAARRLTPRVAMEMNSVEVIKRLVALGFGLSVVPELAVSAELAAGTLAAIPLAGLGRDRKVGVALSSVGTPTRAARAFVALLEAELSGHAAVPR